MKEYFHELSDSIKENKKLPYKLIDCLNCEKGCNGGAGTVNLDLPLDDLENYVEQRMYKQREIWQKKTFSRKHCMKKINKTIDKFWKTKKSASNIDDGILPVINTVASIQVPPYSVNNDTRRISEKCAYPIFPSENLRSMTSGNVI